MNMNLDNLVPALNSFFLESGSAMCVRKVNGTVRFTMGGKQLSYRINMIVSLPEIDFLVYIGNSEVGGPFSVDTRVLTDAKHTRKFFVSSLEEVGRWQTARALYDGVDFCFSENVAAPKPQQRKEKVNPALQRH
ncbi:MAG: hypothetical protein IAF58_01460 [Leptolyngbya sp.]|nr:hypothetical protein [Candidatus Melainabacteria bacterium]